MIKKIRFLLDYKAYPVWLFDEQNHLIDNALPDELKTDLELKSKIDGIQERYDNQFVDTPHEFTYVGFKTAEEIQNFRCDCVNAMKELVNKTNNEYEYVDDISSYLALLKD